MESDAEAITEEELNHSFRGIRLDLDNLQSDANCIGEAIVQPHFSTQHEVALLKDHVAFLAKRILVLHISNEETKIRLDEILTKGQDASSAADSNDAKKNSNIFVEKENSKFSVETQTEFVGSKDSQNSQDSGCLSSSSESPSPTYQSQHDLANDDVIHQTNSALSETATLTPNENYIGPPKSTVLSLLRSLITADVAFTNNLKTACREMDSATRKTSWGQQVEDLFFRHTVFLQLLTSLKDQCCRGLPITADQVMVHLLRFWSDQETIEIYLFFVDFYVRIKEEKETKMSKFSEKSNLFRSDSGILEKFLQNHIFFLNSYLKGFNDSRSLPDVHLVHLLTILCYILERPERLTPNPERLLPKPSTISTPCCIDFDSSFTNISKNEKEISERKKQENNRLEFMEGMSTVTTIYYDFPSEEATENFAKKQLWLLKTEENFKTNQKHAHQEEQKIQQNERKKENSIQRKKSWKKHLRKLLIQNSSVVPEKLSSEI